MKKNYFARMPGELCFIRRIPFIPAAEPLEVVKPLESKGAGESFVCCWQYRV